MDKQNTAQNQPSNGEPGLPFDMIDHLYIGHFNDAAGEVTTVSGADSGPMVYPARFSGEFLIYGQPSEEGFYIEGLRRIALTGQLEKPEENPLIGFISLAGPLEAPEVTPGVDGPIQNIPLRLHYDALTTMLDPLISSPHVEYPQVEDILAEFSWKLTGQPDPTGIDLEVGLDVTELVVSLLGFVTRVTISPQTIHFMLAGSGSNQLMALAIPLNLPGCNSPAGPNRPDFKTVMRGIKLKFVNFSTQVPNIQAVCNNLLTGICTAWSQKGSLYVTEALFDQGNAQTEVPIYQTLTAPEETAIHSLGYATSDHLEVYLVDSTVSAHGGGVTKNAGTGGIYIILVAAQAAANDLLLAHELGHALGLAHPDGTQGVLPSTANSVMQPTALNPDKNTLYNCRVFTCCNALIPSPILTLSPIDYFRPDNDFFIRDFPADTGDELSVLPAGETFWNNSNLWNRRNNIAGGLNPSGGPTHEEPACMDNQDFMFVKLDYTNNLLIDPVDVEVYITEPGAPSTQALAGLSPTPPGNTIQFTLPASNPYTKSLSWSPCDMAAMFPPHSCVFAVAQIHYGCTLCPPRPARTIGNVAPNVLASNKIAQRNINFQCSPPPGPRPLWVWMPWVQMANPFFQPGPAILEIDTQQAAKLDGLVLELDDETTYTFLAGERAQVLLDENMHWEEHRVLRIAAALPAGADLGSRYEIGLTFKIGEAVIAGYQHVLEVSPLAEAVVQTIDALFGALLAVSAGCEIPPAEELANRVQRIYYYHRKFPERALRSLARLSRPLSELAQYIDPFSGRECRQVRAHLLQLAGELQWGHFTSPAARVEALRGQVDRIYEPASRVARRRLLKPREAESGKAHAGN